MELIKRNQHKMEMNASLEETFPLSLVCKQISGYQDGVVLSHWHKEFEVILVTEGEMDYIGEHCEYTLKKGDGLIINGNVLHSFRQRGSLDCHYLVLRFHTSLLGFEEDSLLYRKYVLPYHVGCKRFWELPLHPSSDWQQQLMLLFFEIKDAFRPDWDGYELDICILIQKCWKLLYEGEFKNRRNLPPQHSGDASIYSAVKYIQEHAEEKIYLSDIASACNISTTQCCRIFKHQVGQSPMEYVIKYRIKKSLELLSGTDLAIAQIAELTGFESPSYFTKTFKERMQCTPGEYRRRLLLKR